MHFVNFFSCICLDFCIEKWRGFLASFFWSLFPTKRSAKNPRKIRGKFRAKFGQNPGHKFEKFGELSFCNCSDLTKNGKAKRTFSNDDVVFLKRYHIRRRMILLAQQVCGRTHCQGSLMYAFQMIWRIPQWIFLEELSEHSPVKEDGRKKKTEEKTQT